MNDYLNMYTAIAFILGVMLAAMVKAQAAKLRAKL